MESSVTVAPFESHEEKLIVLALVSPHLINEILHWLAWGSLDCVQPDFNSGGDRERKTCVMAKSCRVGFRDTERNVIHLRNSTLCLILNFSVQLLRRWKG